MIPQIGLIARNREDGENVKQMLSGCKVYVFTRPQDPDGFLLDAVIETARAKENKWYNEIKESSQYCIQNAL